MTFWPVAFILLLTASFSKAQNSSGTLKDLQEQLMSSNSELKSIRHKIETQESLLKGSYSAFLPHLSLAAGYGQEDTLADVHEGYVGYLSGTWNLYRGGKDWQQKKILNHELEAARLEFEITRRRLTRELGEAYYEALLNSHFIHLDSEKIQFLKNQRSMAQKKINAGLTSQIDDLELDLEESTLKAEIESHKTDMQNALNTLAALVANPVDPKVTAQSSIPRLTTADFSNQDLQRNPTLKIQKIREEAGLLQQRQEISSLLPRIDLTAEYGQIIPQFEDPVKTAESKVFVLMSWNFFSGFESYNKIAAAKSTTATLKQTSSQTQRQLQLQLENLLNKSAELLHLQDLLEKRQALTQKYYDLTLSEYRRGIKNSSDLANATNSLFENKTRLLQVRKDLSLLKLKYDELIL